MENIQGGITMLKKGIIIVGVIIMFGLGCSKQPPPEIIEQKPPHRAYLKEFLADSGLTFNPLLKNDFTYYEIYTTDEQLAGFVLLGSEEGFIGPIDLFVKTDTAGVIQHIQVWQHTETPRFVIGMSAFLDTFVDYKVDAELIWQKDVHGITGATVTAEAIIAAVYGSGKEAFRKGIFSR